MNELFSSLARKPSVRRMLIALAVSGAGLFGKQQLQHNADMDRRVGTLEQQVWSVSAAQVAAAVNINWLVRAHGGEPALPPPGLWSAGGAAAAAVPAVDPPSPIVQDSGP